MLYIQEFFISKIIFKIFLEFEIISIFLFSIIFLDKIKNCILFKIILQKITQKRLIKKEYIIISLGISVSDNIHLVKKTTTAKSKNE